MSTDPYRLPSTVTPSHYQLSIAPDLATYRFDATTVVTVMVHEPVSEVILNAADLRIDTVTLLLADGDELNGTTIFDPDHERVTFVFGRELPVGQATLTVNYGGAINDELRGFYRSTFTDPAGVERVIATTQFESTDARRAFPCWDEPEYKATFAIRVLVPDGLLGLSNGAVVESHPGPGGAWVTFETTMKMSTYLVAFVVGPLTATEAVDVDGIGLRVACVPGKEHLGTFALEVGAHALRFLADYFAIPYPAGKLDLVALPDFAFGAMENVGCVTFRETALLVDRDNASHGELQRIADVVAHEIAHMWFGDLVTMRWWNGIWLNEAFATFMEVTTTDHFRPEWRAWEGFSIGRSAAMHVDSLASTRPIEYEVISPEDADGMFDVLTYEKGGSVLKMLETYLGAERFRDGIRLYLDRHRYANTETTDLWDAIEEATGEPVRAIMDSWILQGGHPLVTVTENAAGLALTQQRFNYLLSTDDDRRQSIEDGRWEVPVLLRFGDGTSTRVLLSEATTQLDRPAGSVVVNAGGWGVFRSRYTGALAREVRAGFTSLEINERFNLVGDSWAAVLGGQDPADEFLDLIEAMVDERDPNVWRKALEGIDLVDRSLGAEARAGFATWLRSLLRPVFEHVGWEPVQGEDDAQAKLRGVLVGALATYGDDTQMVEHARVLHAALLEGGSVAPDLLTPIVSVLAWTGDEADYSMFWERIRQAPTPHEEVRYLFRLAGFADGGLLRRTLEATEHEIRSQNASMVIAACVANRWSGREAWEWLSAHWEQVVARVPANSRGRMLEGITTLTDERSLREVPAFLASHPVPSARKQVDQLLELQQVHAGFVRREHERLDRRFTP
ncbi:MAG: M1 family metallopeptidase [Acidimicrobiales bacterium]